MGINLADHFLCIVHTKKVNIRLETQTLNSGGIKYDCTSGSDSSGPLKKSGFYILKPVKRKRREKREIFFVPSRKRSRELIMESHIVPLY